MRGELQTEERMNNQKEKKKKENIKCNHIFHNFN